MTPPTPKEGEVLRVGAYTFRRESDENAKPKAPWRDYSGNRHPIMDPMSATLLDEIARTRAERDAEAAVVEAAEAMCGVIEQPRTDNYREYRTASDVLVAAVTALHAARQGEASGE